MAERMEDPSDGPEAIAALVGTELGERYQLERVLGAGGMGAVFEGKDLRLERPVAVKVMQPGYARDAEYVKRFLREARAASKIRHRNVVVVLDYGKTEGGLVYSVMELLVGQDLEEFLRGQPGQRVGWEQARGLLVQIASGLRAAHGQGVIHRDIKPANCFITMEDDEPVVKVVDFGIAKLGEGMQTQQLTGTGNVLGTPSYTAPEMVLTGGPASPRSDVYSLGVVAYRMLTGRLPFTGKTAFEVMHHACIEAVPGMREPGVEVPAGVEALVLEMLARKPEERPADMGEVRQRLAALGREAGGVQGVVEGAGSSSLRIEVGAAGVSGSGEVVRTEVLDSGQRSEPSGGTEVLDSGQREPSPEPSGGRVAVEEVVERTEVMVGAGFREPSGGALAVPVVAGVAEPKEVLDSGPLERPRRNAVGWFAGVGVIVAMVAAAVTWAVGREGAEGSSQGTRASEVAAVEPPVEIVSKDQPEPELEKNAIATPPPVVIEPHEEVDETTEVEPPKAEQAVQTKALPKKSGVQRPAGPPPDEKRKKELASRIKRTCADELAGKGVTVMFDVTPAGEVTRLTARGAAGECAKAQVAGTKFRTRGSKTKIEIEVK